MSINKCNGKEKDMLSGPTDNNFSINMDKLLEMKLPKFEEKHER